MSDKKPIAETLPDFNAAIATELAGFEFVRVILTLDVCAGRLARYTINREKSVRVEASHG